MSFDLRSVVISDSSMDVINLGRNFLYYFGKFLIVAIGFCNIDPMAITNSKSECEALLFT